MDMVTDLPVTTEGYDSVTVFVDRLSKMVRLAPCRKNMDAAESADLFLHHVFRSHGVLTQFVTDRGSLFVSKFWQAFTQLLGVGSAMSSAFHPQTDGNTERVNRVMEDVLRHYVDAAQTN
jgi:transposase InsO family protein